MQILNNLDMNLNQIFNALAQKLGTDPVSPVEGQFWYNTGTHQLKYYNGSATVIVYMSDSSNTASTNVLRDGSGNISVNKVTVATTTPTSGNELASKSYVDSIASGLQWKASVRAATTANITLSGTQTIDTVSVIAGDRVLVKNQTTGSQNGIYVVASGAWTRATDAATDPQLADGSAVFVDEGSLAGTAWVQTANNPVTIGTTSLVFAQFSGGAAYTAGNGLGLTGNAFSVTTANSGRIVVGGSGIDLAAGIATPGTYSSVTVDTYGRVTAGSDIATGNGVVCKTGVGTYSTRTLTGTGGIITITNPDGVSGNPIINVGENVYVVGGPTVAISDGGTGGTTAAGARASLGATTKYATDIGDGSTTSYTITHNLNTKDIVVAFRDNVTPFAAVQTDWSATTVNTITVSFAVAPTTNKYRVIIVG